jgi:type II secretory pathway component PulF
MEKKGVHFEVLNTEKIEILKEQLCKLKHSGKHLKESLEAQNNMQKTFSRQQNQQSQLSGNVRSLTSGFKKFFTS